MAQCFSGEIKRLLLFPAAPLGSAARDQELGPVTRWSHRTCHTPKRGQKTTNWRSWDPNRLPERCGFSDIKLRFLNNKLVLRPLLKVEKTLNPQTQAAVSVKF